MFFARVLVAALFVAPIFAQHARSSGNVADPPDPSLLQHDLARASLDVAALEPHLGDATIKTADPDTIATEIPSSTRVEPTSPQENSQQEQRAATAPSSPAPGSPQPAHITLTPAPSEADLDTAPNASPSHAETLPQSDVAPTLTTANNTLAAAIPKPGSASHPTIATQLSKGMKVDAKYDINRIGSRGIGSGLDFYSLQKEQALGRDLANEVEHDSRLVTDPVITEYVNRIGQGLVRNSDAKVPFTIKVVDNDEINAFALPGGFFYVNSGLILAAENEAELAGVMAHEIAHVAARHATKNATKAEIWNLASIPLVFVGGPVGYALRQASGLLVPMSFLKFSRDAEREADLLGLEYDYLSGYDPQSFVTFFEKLKVQEKHHKHTGFAKAFSTHPMTEDRIKMAQDEIGRILPPKDDYILDTSDFQAIKARLATLSNTHLMDTGSGVKPTLRKRSSDDKNSSDPKDDGRPTLKRKTGN